MHDESMILGTGASLAAIALCTLPSVSGLVGQLRKRQPRDDAVYEDIDGVATPASTQAFSATLPKTAVLVFAALGAAASLASSILVTLHAGHDGFFLEDWLLTAAWLLILAQAVAIVAIRQSPKAYTFGLYTFVSGAVQMYVVITLDSKVIGNLLRGYPVLFGLRVAELVAVAGLSVASVLLPRRPDVYFENELVDRMYSTSAYGRFTFSWPTSLMNLSMKKKNLDLVDMPRPNGYTRAQNMSADWQANAYPLRRLWLSIARAHAFNFALQWVLTFGTAILNFAPQWVILRLLRILETRVPGEHFGVDVWIWVLWLGIVIIAQSLLESYVFWLSWAELTIPIRAQLSALVFEKAMRRKDVKQGRKKAKEAEEAEEAEEAGEDAPLGAPGKKDGDNADDDEDELESAKKTKQGTVNLIGVDSKRVSDFCAYQNLFPGSLFKMVVSLMFLISLLGWIPLLAGFASMVVIMPVNIYFSRLYADAQDSLMKLRDEKLEVVTEALQGIRQIKFSALEPQWEDKVNEVRERELTSVWSVFKYDSVLIACWITSPIALSAISLAVYAWIHGELIPSVAFVSLGVFRALEMTLSVVPELTTDLLDAWVSIKRLEEYLTSPDLVQVVEDADDVSFDKASVAWPVDEEVDESERFVLRDVDLTFPAGELSVISGKTGTGKSLMLAAILGEVDLLAGTIRVPQGQNIHDRHDAKATRDNWILPKSVAFVAQIPWIENATIRDNIVFGLPVDEERYRKTIDVCALGKDLEMLSDGENTEIGANGINLSGGQKWRITLARAIYSRAGILVLDDIFSAVDAHVGRHIFEKCINGELCVGRTRILVTHHVALCAPKTKYLVELGDGRVLHAGLVSELARDGILDQIKRKEESPDEIHEDETADATAVNSDNSTDNGDDNENDGEADAENTAGGDGAALKKVTSRATQASEHQPQEPKTARKFVEDEKRAAGAVRIHVYAAYLKASGGWPFWTFALLLFVFVQALSVGRSWWLRLWTGLYDEKGEASSLNQSAFGQQALGHTLQYSYEANLQQHTSMHAIPMFGNALGPIAAAGAPASAGTVATYTSSSMSYYMGIYVFLAVLSAVFGSLRYFYIYHGSIRASRSLFAKLNFIILRAPLRWLDTVPVGRVLNRFTADFNIIDSQMANSISFGGNSLIQLFGVVASGLMVSPTIVLMSFVLLAICTRFAYIYVAAARPAKRLESTAKSPVFEQFGTALSGVVTIRGFDKADVYIKRMYRKLDDWSTTTWHLMLFNRWVGWRMSLVGSFFSVVVASTVLSSPKMDSALAGFALAFALDFASCVMWTVRLYANVELQMNAAERIIEYTELPTEDLGGQRPPAAWPTEGRIEANDLVVGYAPDLPPVLKGLSFRIERNQRVGVVGRTGAGKSSLTLALFRFLEARSGSICIDGIDISKIRLHDLRSRLAIIPQDPVLFSGTVRSNLDPFNTHTDEELRDCLARVHLSTSRTSSAVSSGRASPVPETPGSSATSSTMKNVNVFDDLQSTISEGGLNLSQGQRQLLCLARAIVRRPRVMVLDEATSAVDMHTDALIQRSIREEFTDATLLVIAHRLSTIADFDRILVLSDGAVAEFGTPRELWDKGPEEGIFRGMCEESGERDKLEKTVFGEPSSSS
ncbi:ABC bile acid transporter [Niveomyces insectorum RCEF 264]|uniref:ABC bile acid transporter n=1 Tax=Niveomyces insectorum RCEF 264 TaxID=1081102 RepID=A0A168A3G7_9HYPO|nr:ABC bile acid transporter [Niveomyces insectorum RCEF 264]